MPSNFVNRIASRLLDALCDRVIMELLGKPHKKQFSKNVVTKIGNDIGEIEATFVKFMKEKVVKNKLHLLECIDF